MHLLKTAFSIIASFMRLKLIFIIFLILTSGLIELFSIGIIFPILSILIDPRDVEFLGLSVNFKELFLNMNSYELVLYVVIIFNLIIFFKNVVLYLTQYLKVRFFVNLNTAISGNMYKKYMSKNLLFHIEQDTSFLIRNIYNEVRLFNKKILSQLIDLLQNLLIFTGLVIILLSFRFYETILLSSILIFIALIYFFIFKKTIDTIGKKRIEYEGLILKHLRQSLDGYREIVIYKAEKFFKDNLLKKLYKRETFGKIISLISFAPKHILEVIIVLLITFAGLYLYSTEPEIKNIVPEAALLFAITIRMLPLVNKIILNFNTLRFSSPSAEIIYNELNKTDLDIKNENLNHVTGKNINLKNSIDFKNVKFKYPKSKDYVFENLNLTFKKGEVIGIIGKSGIGKSTLLDLVAGFLAPSEGEILVDGKNILNNKKWKEKISYVSQNIFLTDDTIKNNIIFGNEKEFDEQLYLKSLNLSNSKEFIDKLESGSNTVVGEKGLKFSGGQRQRVNIARAIYKGPEVMILDEATSALDEKNEELIINSLINLRQNLTIFLSTHKKNLISKCDSILEIHNKQVNFKNK